MPPPEAHFRLSLPILRQHGGYPDQELIRSVQFMLLVDQSAYSPWVRALRPADGVDGIFGPKTDQWVRAFQRKWDLKVDGVVGEQTWSEMLSRWTSLAAAG
jgi:peptidoglycan hydrolase-like protein with peptidoglycan-binding domain